jgi:GT2 family glycosyltransferase
MRSSARPGSLTVDVIVATKDRPRDVERLLTSLADQTEPPDRVLVVDAGAPPLELPRAYPFPVEIVRSEPGLVRQRNEGLARAVADVVAFFDDDVELEPEYLEVVRRWFEAHSETSGVSGETVNDRERPAASRLFRRVFALANDDGRLRASGDVAYLRHPLRPTRVDVIPGHSMIYRREKIAGLRFDSRIEGTYGGEDVDFAMRASLRGELWMVPAARLAHLKSTTSRLDSRQRTRQIMINNAYLFAKHRETFRLRPLPYARRVSGRVIAYGLLALSRRSPGAFAGALAGVVEMRERLRRGARSSREL